MGLNTTFFNTTNTSTTAYNYNYNFVYSLSTNPYYQADVLVVGGGGGGGFDSTGSRASGGGGAGGYVALSAILMDNTTYSITIGAGGTGQNYASRLPYTALSGKNTTFINTGNPNQLSIVAIGGGSGSSANWGDFPTIGGSGGGGSYGGSWPDGALGTLNQGFSGGRSSIVGNDEYGGGGGGAAEPGNTDGRGHGGDGLMWLDGVFYAGGGAGDTSATIPISGGVGGGGNSGSGILASLRNGQPNTGGGGGGSGSTGSTEDGGAGGSGIVVIRYPIPQKSNSGNLITIKGNYVYHYFYNSGTFLSTTVNSF